MNWFTRILYRLCGLKPAPDQPAKKYRIVRSQDGKFGLEYWAGSEWNPPIQCFDSLDDIKGHLARMEKWETETQEAKARIWTAVDP